MHLAPPVLTLIKNGQRYDLPWDEQHAVALAEYWFPCKEALHSSIGYEIDAGWCITGGGGVAGRIGDERQRAGRTTEFFDLGTRGT